MSDLHDMGDYTRNGIMNEQIKGTIYVLLAAIALSLSGLFVKLATWDSIAVLGGKSAATLAVAAVYMKMTNYRFVFNKPVILGGICLSLISLMFTVATRATSAANAIVLQYTQPFFVILLLWLIYKQRPAKAEITAVVIAFVGILFFFMDKLTPGGMTGNIIAICSGFVYAVFMLIKKMKGSDYVSSVVLSAVLNVVTCGWRIPMQTDWRPVPVLMVALFGTVSCFFGYLFLSAGLDRIPLVTGALLTMLEPVLNPIWVALFYGETMGVMSVVGTVILLGTAAVYSVRQIRKEQPDAVR
ncbi:MAG: EamA family transporter [Lachnospiraceae bacterium]|nr:EamA family transporter [Lachnospiraceae bacterium]